MVCAIVALVICYLIIKFMAFTLAVAAVIALFHFFTPFALPYEKPVSDIPDIIIYTYFIQILIYYIAVIAAVTEDFKHVETRADQTGEDFD